MAHKEKSPVTCRKCEGHGMTYHPHQTCWMCCGRKTLSAYEYDLSPERIEEVYKIRTDREGKWFKVQLKGFNLNQGRHLPNRTIIFVTSEMQFTGLLDGNAIGISRRYYTVRKMDAEGEITLVSKAHHYRSRGGAVVLLWKEVEKLRGSPWRTMT